MDRFRSLFTGHDFFLQFVFVCVAIVVLRNVGPEVEEIVAPVVDDIRVTDIAAGPSNFNGWTQISGELSRNRDCDFKGVQFYYEDNGHEIIADHVFLEPTKIRAVGSSEFGPWLIQLDKEQLKSARFKSVHDCHIGWYSITEGDVLIDGGAH